jgi:hypothetical protein
MQLLVGKLNNFALERALLYFSQIVLLKVGTLIIRNSKS